MSVYAFVGDVGAVVLARGAYDLVPCGEGFQEARKLRVSVGAGVEVGLGSLDVGAGCADISIASMLAPSKGSTRKKWVCSGTR